MASWPIPWVGLCVFCWLASLFRQLPVTRGIVSLVAKKPVTIIRGSWQACLACPQARQGSLGTFYLTYSISLSCQVGSCLEKPQQRLRHYPTGMVLICIDGQCGIGPCALPSAQCVGTFEICANCPASVVVVEVPPSPGISSRVSALE